VDSRVLKLRVFSSIIIGQTGADVALLESNMSLDDRVQLARVIMNILDTWGVDAEGKIFLLGLPEDTRTRHLSKFYHDTPLPDDPEVAERIDHVLGIARALRTSYPANPKMATFWLNTRNKKFQNRTPLDAMLQDGLQGMMAVRVHLDCAWDWDREDEEIAARKREQS